MVLTEQTLGAACVPYGALRPTLDRSQRRLALGLRRLNGAGAGEAVGGSLEAGVDLAQLLFELAGALRRGALGRAQVQGERPELGPQALERIGQLGLAAGEAGGSDRDSLLLAAQLSQQPPGLGALTVAGRKALLRGTAPLADRRKALLDPRPLGASLFGGRFRRLGSILAEAQFLGDQATAQLQLLALDPGAQLRRLRLALQRPQPRPRLTLQVESAVEVVARRAQLQLGAAAAFAVLAEPRRLLDQQPALARFRVNDRLDPALADHRVHLASQVRVGEDLDHVDETTASAVHPVDAIPGAIEAALDRDLRQLGRSAAFRVVDHHLDFGGATLADALAAGRDHVLHRSAADRSGALLAERPEHGVGDVRLAGAVRARRSR